MSRFKCHPHIYILFLFILFVWFAPFISNAQSATEIRDKISSQQSDIQNLESEIHTYTQQLTTIGKEKQSLKNAVKELDVSNKKVTASISLAQKQINNTSHTINNLNDTIELKKDIISHSQKALGETMRQIDINESTSFIVTVLGTDDISAMWDDLDTLQQFQVVVRNSVKQLTSQKKDLEAILHKKEVARTVLVGQRTELSDQQTALTLNRNAKNTLLKETSNRESTYQDLLSAKRKEKSAFEDQLRIFQEKLKYILDPSKIPPTGKNTLKWPLKNIKITQYFGSTAFSRTGAYNGRGHNGVDFRAAIGTPIYAALSGKVWRTNESIGRNCQYGKWILIKHANGLATLYGHLSKIKVTDGETVVTGETIGYSGFTGYATGPHLHLTVYVADAVSFRKYTCKSGPTVTIPVAAYSAYLNPLDYLK